MRRKHTPEFKLSLVQESFKKTEKNAELCRKHNICEQLLYNWQKIYTNAGKKALGINGIDNDQLSEKIAVNELLNNQKMAINELNEINNYLLKLLHMSGIIKKYTRYTKDEKKEIIAKIENSTLSKTKALKKFGVTKTSYYNWKCQLSTQADNIKPNFVHKYENPDVKRMVFSILHSPPKEYGFNRTTWRMEDVYQSMKKKGFPIGKNYIRQIIKNEGYRFIHARKVLTSTDPQYKEKLRKITEILSNLGEKDKFFSIDEYGPFSIKVKGGKSLVPYGTFKTYQQFQKSKGWLILTAALELSTNQVTHFYSKKKDTEEMIKLLEILVKKYHGQNCIYLSWDAASWHISKKLKAKVDEINEQGGKPKVKLAPLPACSQFLNIIESVFSGMAKAIIHNSNYGSVEECMNSINTYFKERNEYFIKNPKRAGNKLWGEERVTVKFSESNNCKDPKYLHNF